jgi:flagellar biosynthesis/type III secretory pathway protein FliH
VKKWQAALTIILVAVIAGNVLFWNTTYASNGQASYSLGYQQGQTDEQPTVYQSGFAEGNFTGWTEGNQTGYLDGYKNGNSVGNLTGFTDGNKIGYDTGYATGYNLGNSTGYSAGESIGHQTGYAVGLSDGNKSGYNQGYEMGYQTGDINGFTHGNSSGYDLGYSTGTVAGEQTGFAQGNSSGYLAGLETGLAVGHNKHDPTYAEMRAFLDSDGTDLKVYPDDGADWLHRGIDLKINAYNKGFLCALVYVDMQDYITTCVAFNTTDRGLIFIYPQNDAQVALVAGQSYWDRSMFQAPTNDDTVLNYYIAW